MLLAKVIITILSFDYTAIVICCETMMAKSGYEIYLCASRPKEKNLFILFTSFCMKLCLRFCDRRTSRYGAARSTTELYVRQLQALATKEATHCEFAFDERS